MEQRLIGLFRENLNVTVPAPDTDLIHGGLLDSLTLVDLLLLLEREFGVSVQLDQFEIDQFRTVRSIAAFLGARAPARPA